MLRAHCRWYYDIGMIRAAPAALWPASAERANGLHDLRQAVAAGRHVVRTLQGCAQACPLRDGAGGHAALVRHRREAQAAACAFARRGRSARLRVSSVSSRSRSAPVSHLRRSQDPNARLARRIFIGIFVAATAMGGASYFGQRESGAHTGDPASCCGVRFGTRCDPAAGVTAPRNEAAAIPTLPSVSAACAGNAVPLFHANPSTRRSPLCQRSARSPHRARPSRPPTSRIEGPNVAREPAKVAAVPVPAPPPPPFPTAGRTCAMRRRNAIGRA